MKISQSTLLKYSVAVAATTVLAGDFSAQAATFQFTPIDYSEQSETTAVGINDAGVVVGSVDTADTSSAFFYESDRHTLFNVTLNETTYRSFANGINAVGIIVGGFDAAPEVIRGFIRNPDGQIRILPNLNDQTVRVNPLAINTQGTIVGAYGEDPTEFRGFIYADESYTTIYEYPGAQRTQFSSINTDEVIVGRWQDSEGQWNGLIYRNGIASTYNLPGATRTDLFGINDLNQIVGYYQTIESGQTITRGFLLENALDDIPDNDVITPIDYPNTDQNGTRAYAINNRGQIAGTYNGFSNAYVTTLQRVESVPEPATGLGLMITAAFFWFRHRSTRLE